MIYLIVSTFILFIYIIIILRDKDLPYYYEELPIKNKILKVFLVPIFSFLSKHLQFPSKYLSKQSKKSISYFQEKRYVRYYMVLHVSKKFLLIFWVSVLGLLINSIINSMAFTGLLLLLIIFTNMLIDKLEAEKYLKTKNKVKEELPNLILKLSLMNEAGLNLVESVKILADEKSSILANELYKLVTSVNNGKEQSEAFANIELAKEDLIFKKLLSIILQNQLTGSNNLSKQLNNLNEEAWRNKKALIIENSKKASQKLLIPNLLIFFSIMLMVMIPMIIKTI